MATKEDVPSAGSTPRVRSVIDISSGSLSEFLRAMLKDKLLSEGSQQQRRLPSAVLSDDLGLQLWTRCTDRPEYYFTRGEIELLEHWGPAISQHVETGSTLIDLGAGNIRKVHPLLEALEAAGINVQYFALDLSRASLERGMEQLPSTWKHVRCYGLWGTFDDALAWSKTIAGPKWFLSLGAIFGNDRFEVAVASLAAWAQVLRPQDRMLVGMDACKDEQKVWQSYNDSDGVWHQFIRNGLAHSNQILGHSWYRAEDWDISGVYEENPSRHRYVLRALRDVDCDPLKLHLTAGEKIVSYECFKYGPDEMRRQFAQAGLEEIETYKAPNEPIYQYLLRTPEANAAGANGPKNQDFLPQNALHASTRVTNSSIAKRHFDILGS